jgi:hypothetical protein
MKKTMSWHPALGGLAISALLSVMSPALAETTSFKAELSGASEVPATSSKGTGSVTATYDSASKQLSYTVDYSGLSGPATAAHFHGPAAPGQNAGVAAAIPAPVTSPIKGTLTLNDAQQNDLMSGKWYLNIHTAANKGGEIRGQLQKSQ